MSVDYRNNSDTLEAPELELSTEVGESHVGSGLPCSSIVRVGIDVSLEPYQER